MRCLIRQLTRKGKTGIAHKERWVDADSIDIGRGTDQHILVTDMRAALSHASIQRTDDGEFELASVGAAGFRINDRLQQHARLRTGDRVEIGTTSFVVMQPQEGADLVLEVQPELPRSQAGAAETGVPERNVLSPGPVSKRFWSWFLFLGILSLFLALPVTGFFRQDAQQFLRESPLPSDHSWETGGLVNAHGYFSADCNKCHERPFTRAGDMACLQCHRGIGDHAHTPELARAGAFAENCRSCHEEHSGPAGLILSDQRLCSSCHDAHGLAGAPIGDLEPAGDFGLEHPQFRITLPDHAGGGDTRRLPVDSPHARESATLKFPHDTHLDPQGLQAPMGRIVLECADCHVQEPGGGLMAPVRMEQHCIGCHSLALDPSYPQREVPHGKPEEIVYLVSEYFARLAIEGAYWVEGQPAVRFATTAEARAWAYDQALRAAAGMFEDRACGTCHQVDRHDTPEGPRWEVRPAVLVHQWFPGARFSHAKHRAMECADCHDAASSSSSEDVLMPGIADCQACHGGQAPGRARIASTCVTCHDFHTVQRPSPTAVLGVDSGVLRARPEDIRQDPTTPRRRRPGQ